MDSRKETDAAKEIGGFRKERYTMGCDIGTHIDSPGHFICGGRFVHELSLNELTAPGAVVDVTEKCKGDAAYQLSVDDLTQWETEFGKIPDNALVVMKTGWCSRFTSSNKSNGGGDYLNKDKDGKMMFPGFSPEAARWLIAERSIVGIGIDTASLDYGLTSTYPVHVIILGADKYQIENMKLREVPAGQSCVFISLPIKVKDGPEAEARVMAVLK